jgi:membrane associated rhomboid family serine protease
MPRINITPVVLNLLIINGLVFLALNLYNSALEPYFMVIKSDLIIPRPNYVFPNGDPAIFRPIQIVTGFFSHEAVWHIFMNMFALISIGSVLETVMGAKRFLLAYLVIGVVSTTIIAFLDPSDNPVLGASGAISGLSVLWAYYMPNLRLQFLFIPFSLTTKQFAIGFAALSTVMVIVGLFQDTNVGRVSHFGHLAGMVVGFLYLQIGGLRKIGRR